MRYEDLYETQNHLLGQGAFAQVFLAIKKSNRQKVAVKISNRNLAISQKEKIILKQLSQHKHPNVIQILDIFEQNNTLLIVQEYCPGGTLYETMTNRKFTEDQIVHLATQIASGLQFLHSYQFVHRDLKPENILRYIDDTGTESYKITDFGLSSMKQDRMTTVKVGTAYYVAPEILLDKDGYDKTVDIWALGLIVDELLHGTPFYNGQSEEEVFNKIRNEQYYIRNQEINKATIFDHKKNIIKTLLNNTIQRDPKQRKDLVFILQLLTEYFLQSPMSEIVQDRYSFKEVTVFSQPITADQTQIFQTPVEFENICPLHKLPILFRMPSISGENQVDYACKKCLLSYGILDIVEFQQYIQQASQEIQMINLDNLFSQNTLIIESLKYLDQYQILKEKEKLISELRQIVQKQQRTLKMEFIQYQDDLKQMNVNAQWINEALKLQIPQVKDMPNKLILYVEQRIVEQREYTLNECRSFIKEELNLFRQDMKGFLKDQLKQLKIEMSNINI